MERREFLLAGLSLPVTSELLVASAGEKPLAVKVSVQPVNGIVSVLTPEQRKRIIEHYKKHFEGTNLEGAAVLVCDGLVDVEVVVD